MDWYANLTYRQYKDLERQCRAFEEGTHGEGTEYYHKAFAVVIGDTRIEFHGPNVKARQTEILEACDGAQCEQPRGHSGPHDWHGRQAV